MISRMGTLRVAKRYAKGLFEYASEMREDDAVYADMQNMILVIGESRDLCLFLQSPLLNPKKKIKIAKEVFKSFSEVSKRFIELLILHKRERLLGWVAVEYQKMHRLAQGIVEALVITAVQLDEVLQRQIVDNIVHILGMNKRYQLINKIDPTVIGGFLLRVGDKQWDLTISGQLARLRREILGCDYVKRY